ncbi:MAG: sulfur carrier protein ThiS [Kiritimatiellaeota bacterium]|nr:sulfur carrier protein ThiS [Kiritimatiellota bacterium]
MRLNGENFDVKSGATLLSLLETLGHKPERVAAELNGVIVPREKFGETALRDTDTLEIVCFVGGG